MDEHRIGPKPILGARGAPEGKRPTVVVRPRYVWLYVAAFVCLEQSDISFWFVPTMDANVFQLLVDAFSREAWCGRERNASCPYWTAPAGT